MPGEAKTALSTGAVDAWCSWGVYVAQAQLVDQLRVVVDGGGGLLTGLSYLVATDAATARCRDALLDFSRRLAVARRWAQAHPDDYARVLAAEIGVTQPVARLVFDTEIPVPVPIDAVSVEFIGYVGHFNSSETMRRTGLALDPGYIEAVAKTHEHVGFDRVLIAFNSTSAESILVVLCSTRHHTARA